MPQLHAFHAVTYQPFGDLSTRIAPPYDVLDEQPKQALLRRDPHNIVAVDLPVTPPKTLGPDEAYEQAGRTFRQWLDEGVLRRLDRPGVVAYEQVYQVADRTLRRRGLFAALGVEDFNHKGGGIHRHEHTIQGGLDDRYKLMEATRAQLSPIFAAFPDPQQRVAQLLEPAFRGEPDFFGVTDSDGVRHHCWLIDDADTIAQLADFFRGTDVFIADGHHRYTTALNYARRHPEQSSAQTCLFVLVAAENPGMIVLPTHRVMTGCTHGDIGEVLDALRSAGVTVSETRAEASQLQAQLPEAGPHAMGLVDGRAASRFILTFEADPLASTHGDKPPVWRQLDVAILEHAVLERIIRPRFGGRLQYTADTDDVARMLARDPASLGFLMQPTPLASVMAVSLADEVMPAKSTYFYPKLATGLTINPLD